MEAKELRIGNWVKMGDQYIEMDVKMFHAVIHGFPGYEPEPIPLTEEILLKAGFIKIEEKTDIYELGRLRLWLGSGCLCYLIDEDSLMGHYLKNINYLHQLQNLVYILTNKELTINI